MLEAAKQPLVILGGSRWTRRRRGKSVAAWRERRPAGRDLVPPRAAVSRRSPELRRRSRHRPQPEAGRAHQGGRPLAAGRRAPVGDAVILLHADRHSRRRGRSWCMCIPVPRNWAASISRRSPSRPRPCRSARRSRDSTGSGRRHGARRRARRMRTISPGRKRRASCPGAFQYGEVMCWLRDRLPADAIICNGAGNFSIWIHRYYRFRGFGTQLAPTSGSMGYGVPAAVMAKRQHPDRIVVALCRRRRLPDERPGVRDRRRSTAFRSSSSSSTMACTAPSACIRRTTIRAASSATRPEEPGFRGACAALWRPSASGWERTEEFAPAFERALASGKPAILHCMLDPQAITPAMTLDGIRDRALGRA